MYLLTICICCVLQDQKDQSETKVLQENLADPVHQDHTAHKDQLVNKETSEKLDPLVKQVNISLFSFVVLLLSFVIMFLVHDV